MRDPKGCGMCWLGMCVIMLNVCVCVYCMWCAALSGELRDAAQLAVIPG